jgi:hypothetical protein
VPTPPTEAFLAQDPLDDILAEMGAISANEAAEPAHKTVTDSVEELEETVAVEPTEVAPIETETGEGMAEPAVDEAAADIMLEQAPEFTPAPEESMAAAESQAAPDLPSAPSIAPSEALSGPSSGGAEVAKSPAGVPSRPEPETLREIPPSIPAYEYVPPEPTAPSVVSAPSAPESPPPIAETAAVATGVAAIWSGFVAQGASQPSGAAPLDDAAEALDILDGGPDDVYPDTGSDAPEPATLENKPDPFAAPEADAGLAADIEASIAAAVSAASGAEPDPETGHFEPSTDIEATVEAGSAADTEPVVETGIKEAPSVVAEAPPAAPAPHWSQIVAEAPSAPVAPVAAQQGMEEFIRELKEEPVSKEVEDNRPSEAALDMAETETVFHPWEGEAAPEVPDETSVDPVPEAPLETADMPASAPVVETAETEAQAPLPNAPHEMIPEAQAPISEGMAVQDEPAEDVSPPLAPVEAAPAVAATEIPVDETAPEEAPEEEVDDDFEWEEHPDPEGEIVFAPVPDEEPHLSEQPHLKEQPSTPSGQSDEALRLKAPEISNVIQANIPQAPSATMGRPSSAAVETPRKPTPVDATDDIEAAIRAQLSNFPKKNMASPSAVEPEKKGIFGKKPKAAPKAVTPPPVSAKPIDPLKAALLDTGSSKTSRFGKRAGFITVMVLFALMALVYVLGDSLSAMVPALAPVIGGLSAVIDTLRGLAGGLMGG